MEQKPKRSFNDKEVIRRTKSGSDRAAGSSSDKDAALLWWLITTIVIFLFTYAPLAFRIFTRKNIGVNSIGLFSVILGYLWTRFTYLLLIETFPCYSFSFDCFTMEDSFNGIGEYSYWEIFYPWKIWNPDFPSFLPIFGTFILIFGVFHWVRTLYLPADSEEDANSRGESLLNENNKDYSSLEPPLLIIIGIVLALIGDWRFGVAMAFGGICLFFEEIRAEARIKEMQRQIKQAELLAANLEKLQEIDKTLQQYVKENKSSSQENRNIAE